MRCSGWSLKLHLFVSLFICCLLNLFSRKLIYSSAVLVPYLEYLLTFLYSKSFAFLWFFMYDNFHICHCSIFHSFFYSESVFVYQISNFPRILSFFIVKLFNVSSYTFSVHCLLQMFVCYSMKRTSFSGELVSSLSSQWVGCFTPGWFEGKQCCVSMFLPIGRLVVWLWGTSNHFLSALRSVSTLPPCTSTTAFSICCSEMTAYFTLIIWLLKPT